MTFEQIKQQMMNCVFSDNNPDNCAGRAISRKKRAARRIRLLYSGGSPGGRCFAAR